ncbi:MAG: hypothetical protein ACC657_16160, partial [Thiohalomonadales bacterium]
MVLNNNEQLIEESNRALEKCNQVINSIAKTCCIPERSPNMIEAQSLITGMMVTTNEINNNIQN